MKRFSLILILILTLTACGSRRVPIGPPVSTQADIAQWVYRFPDVSICSGGTVVQTFHNSILANGDMAQENHRPSDSTGAGHQMDLYWSDAAGINYRGSLTLDANGLITAMMQSVIQAFALPLTVTEGSPVSLSGHTSYRWGQCTPVPVAHIAQLSCNWTYKSGEAATRTFVLVNGVLTSVETAVDDDPAHEPFDLTMTYDASGLRSVSGFGRCN